MLSGRRVKCLVNTIKLHNYLYAGVILRKKNIKTTVILRAFLNFMVKRFSMKLLEVIWYNVYYESYSLHTKKIVNPKYKHATQAYFICSPNKFFRNLGFTYPLTICKDIGKIPSNNAYIAENVESGLILTSQLFWKSYIIHTPLHYQIKAYSFHYTLAPSQI